MSRPNALKVGNSVTGLKSSSFSRRRQELRSIAKQCVGDVIRPGGLRVRRKPPSRAVRFPRPASLAGIAHQSHTLHDRISFRLARRRPMRADRSREGVTVCWKGFGGQNNFSGAAPFRAPSASWLRGAIWPPSGMEWDAGNSSGRRLLRTTCRRHETRPAPLLRPHAGVRIRGRGCRAGGADEGVAIPGDRGRNRAPQSLAVPDRA